MAKKPVEPKKFSKEELQAAYEITHKEYFTQMIALMSHDDDLKELNYVKVPLTTPQGGNYLISILHIDGPKVNLRDLAEAAEAEEQNKNPGT